jgi:hypothetical protein
MDASRGCGTSRHIARVAKPHAYERHREARRVWLSPLITLGYRNHSGPRAGCTLTKTMIVGATGEKRRACRAPLPSISKLLVSPQIFSFRIGPRVQSRSVHKVLAGLSHSRPPLSDHLLCEGGQIGRDEVCLRQAFNRKDGVAWTCQ